MNKRKITVEAGDIEETLFLFPNIMYAWENRGKQKRYAVGLVFLKWGLSVILTVRIP